jgi:hypothetical protein
MKRKKFIIPKESKQIKYLYFIIVNFKGERILKFGVSNNYIRRFTEYNNSNTVGFIIEILDIYYSDKPKRIETMLKWYMNQVDKPVFKFEYFDLKYYEFLKSKALELATQFGIILKKIQ